LGQVGSASPVADLLRRKTMSYQAPEAQIFCQRVEDNAFHPGHRRARRRELLTL
jgi:hypothetical protein